MTTGEVPINHKVELSVFSKPASRPDSKGRDTNLIGKPNLSKFFEF